MKTEDILDTDTILEMEDHKQEIAEEEKETLANEENDTQPGRGKCLKPLCTVATLKKVVPILQWLPR